MHVWEKNSVHDIAAFYVIVYLIIYFLIFP